SRFLSSRFRRVISGLGNRHLITLRRKRMLDVFAQWPRIDVSRTIRRVVKLNVRNLWRKLSVTQEVEIVARWIPRRIVRVEVIVSDASHLTVVRTPNKH